jgi:hypothetical protein
MAHRERVRLFDPSGTSISTPLARKVVVHRGRRTGVGTEHQWSQAGATGGNPSQTHPPKKRLRNADRQPVATPRNKQTFDGKEGVDGSSPSEGFAKLLQNERFGVVLVACIGDVRSHHGRTEL